MATENTEIKEKSLNFIEEIIEESIAKGEKRVQTRFPPEPNGYLHIGHAKSICINFGMAKKYGGKCNLRFDDTNPVKEDTEYVDSIKRDIQWLGFQWAEERYASDYFDQLYEWAVVLIKKGLAYVDDQTQEQIRETRGTISEPGTPSPWRDRSVEENLDLRKAASASGNKRVEMLPLRELTGLTGYQRGGCSPIGMKKQYRTVIHETAQLFDKIIVSGGKLGTQIVIKPSDLIKVTNAIVSDIVKE